MYIFQLISKDEEVFFVLYRYKNVVIEQVVEKGQNFTDLYTTTGLVKFIIYMYTSIISPEIKKKSSIRSRAVRWVCR